MKKKNSELIMKLAENITWKVAKPDLFFKCEYGVFPKKDGGPLGSICYCTSKERAQFIADAINELNEYRKKYKGKK
jgi:hypothetical protein